MDTNIFHQYLNQSILSQGEKRKAWKLFHENPESAVAYVRDIESHFSQVRREFALRQSPIPYKIWGSAFIEEEALNQMANAARLPVSVAGALMPDAHSGYGLPIGGVLATENSVIPYAVGVDIACRMMMTIYPTSSEVLQNRSSPEYQNLVQALVKNTVFGAGSEGIHDGKIDHPILDKANWQISNLTRTLRDTAIYQIGTSGGGNHFVEWGALEITDAHNAFNIPVGHYLALLSHSGSRGVGFKIANHYTEIAMSRLPELDKAVKHLAWLDLGQDIGKEYWESMQLAGEFASANHHVIHQRIGKAIGMDPIASIENHHNFAWKERVLVNGREKEAIVHRKGATPAGKGVLGIIPGTMADPGYLVVGKGNEESLNSASHGSGRQMARTKAKKTISYEEHKRYLQEHDVELIGGGLDESPQAYKPIDLVMNAQQDLVGILGKFQPKIVRMAAEERGNRFRKKKAPRGIVEGE